MKSCVKMQIGIDLKGKCERKRMHEASEELESQVNYAGCSTLDGRKRKSEKIYISTRLEEAFNQGWLHSGAMHSNVHACNH